MLRSVPPLVMLAVLGVAGCELVLPSEHEISGGVVASGADAANVDGASTDADGTSADAGRGVAFVAAASAKALDASAIAVTLPEPPRDGDLLVAIVYDGLGEASTRSTVSGPDTWTLQRTNGYWTTFYGFAAGGAATYSFSMTKGGSFGWPHAVVVLAAYRGVDPMHPIADARDLMVPAETEGTETTITAPSVVTSEPDSRIVILGGADGSNLGPGWTAPPGTTERSDVGWAMLIDAAQPNAGASGTKDIGHVGTGWSAYLNVLALSPRP